ncbi:methyltransferase 13 [Olea europaea subsp. europaea]|nr:methyltransferase 13 [Olea europaea subsp. europaea]
MEPKLGPRLGNEYLSEVRRVLKVGGKFICLTLAESHVLELLFPKFRFGWKLSLHAIPQNPSRNHRPQLQTFMVIAEKDNSTVVSQMSSFIDQSSIEYSGNQAREFFKAVERENEVRTEYSLGSDIFHSLEDLKLGSKGNLEELNPGRRVQLTLGEPGLSRFSYKAVLLDAQKDSGPFTYHCGVFLVPKTRAREWLFSSEEGQWLVVESSKAARLVMILLDSSNSNGSMDDIQKDLSPLVKQLAPGDCNNGAQIPFMAASDGIKQRSIVHKATSNLTGPIIVDDVIYEKVDDDLSRRIPFNDVMFRRLIFQRSSKSKRKGNQRRVESHATESFTSRSKLKVDHNYLASSYHNGIISGLMLISSYLERVSSAGGTVKAIVIGLGAGLLPKFLHKCLPFLEIEVVELDPVVLDVARDYFSFEEDKHLKVHITDGIKFVREIANFEAGDVSTPNCSDKNDTVNGSFSSGTSTEVHADGRSSNKMDILIIDVDSSDLSSGLTCPASDFVEDSFLLTVKSSLSEQGLFVINLVSRSSAVKDKVFSRLQTVFSNIFSLQLEEDLNEVIFALKDSPVEENQFSEACDALARLLELENPEWSQSIIDGTKLIKRLR